MVADMAVSKRRLEPLFCRVIGDRVFPSPSTHPELKVIVLADPLVFVSNSWNSPLVGTPRGEAIVIAPVTETLTLGVEAHGNVNVAA
jgi:hypothetical protein